MAKSITKLATGLDLEVVATLSYLEGGNSDEISHRCSTMMEPSKRKGRFRRWNPLLALANRRQRIREKRERDGDDGDDGEKSRRQNDSIDQVTLSASCSNTPSRASENVSPGRSVGSIPSTESPQHWIDSKDVPTEERQEVSSFLQLDVSGIQRSVSEVARSSVPVLPVSSVLRSQSDMGTRLVRKMRITPDEIEMVLFRDEHIHENGERLKVSQDDDILLSFRSGGCIEVEPPADGFGGFSPVASFDSDMVVPVVPLDIVTPPSSPRTSLPSSPFPEVSLGRTRGFPSPTDNRSITADSVTWISHEAESKDTDDRPLMEISFSSLSDTEGQKFDIKAAIATPPRARGWLAPRSERRETTTNVSNLADNMSVISADSRKAASTQASIDGQRQGETMETVNPVTPPAPATTADNPIATVREQIFLSLAHSASFAQDDTLPHSEEKKCDDSVPFATGLEGSSNDPVPSHRKESIIDKVPLGLDDSTKTRSPPSAAVVVAAGQLADDNSDVVTIYDTTNDTDMVANTNRDHNATSFDEELVAIHDVGELNISASRSSSNNMIQSDPNAFRRVRTVGGMSPTLEEQTGRKAPKSRGRKVKRKKKSARSTHTSSYTDEVESMLERASKTAQRRFSRGRSSSWSQDRTGDASHASRVYDDNGSFASTASSFALEQRGCFVDLLEGNEDDFDNYSEDADEEDDDNNSLGEYILPPEDSILQEIGTEFVHTMSDLAREGTNALWSLQEELVKTMSGK